MNKHTLPLFLICLSTLFMASCGIPLKKHIVQKNGSRQFSTSNSAFTSEIKKFISYAKSELKDSSFELGDVPVNYGDTENNDFDGVCFSYGNGDKEVLIRKSWWLRASELQREVMILHELGHCRLGRDHDTETYQNSSTTVKASIMNPVIPDSFSYDSYKKEYLIELFTYNKNSFSALFTASQ